MSTSTTSTALDAKTYIWRKVETTGTVPMARANHSSSSIHYELFIFGGWNGKERLNDIHILNTKSNVWTKPFIGGTLPNPRAGMTLTALRGRLYLFGGSGSSSKCFKDLQILDRKRMIWLDVSTHEDGQIGDNNFNEKFVSNFHTDEGEGEGESEGEGEAEGEAEAESEGESEAEKETETETSAETEAEIETDIDIENLEISERKNSGMEEWAASVGATQHNSPHHSNYGGNPNSYDDVPTVQTVGKGPGRRAGHTATAVDREIFVFGGSCGAAYLSDFFVLDTDPLQKVKVDQQTRGEILLKNLEQYSESKEFSDIVFRVEGREVYCHKVVLSSVSDCFRAMFSSG